ncbi:uncharacterized protein ACO6RY_07960 [Pungitius sinensis]
MRCTSMLPPSSAANHNGQDRVRELPLSVRHGRASAAPKPPPRDARAEYGTRLRKETVNVATKSAIWCSCQSLRLPEARLYSNPFLLLSAAGN